MTLAKKLSDLYVRGREVTLKDGDNEVTVYLRKIMPVDAEAAYRAANAERAKAMALRNDPDSPIFQFIKNRCESATKEEMVEQLAELETQRRRPVIEAEVQAEDKWAKDDYLQGLYDSWESGLKEKHFKDPDEETKRVFDEMQEFDEQLKARMDRELESQRKDLESLSHQKVADKFFDAQMDQQAEIAWFKEYRRQELFYALRDPDDHTAMIFEDPIELEQLENPVIEELRDAYNDISVDALEGKD